MQTDIKDILASGQSARLIPTVADSKKEERATSALLASFMVVPEFARQVLSSAGAPSGKRIEISCYTEVCFKTNGNERNCRPDGLIVITSQGRRWGALVESKVGNSELTTEQIEEYLDLAKRHGLNAVITISNQFATTPSHHPVQVSRQKLRSVELYHFSWLSIKSIALIMIDNKKLDDPEQAFILSEVYRFLDHEYSGVSSLNRMAAEWKDVYEAVQQKAVLSKISREVEQSVISWHQLARHLGLNLSMQVAQPVSVALSRNRARDPALNFQEDCSSLANDYKLEAEFDIPDAAARIHVLADFRSRTLDFSMKLEAPKDKTKATACINWFTRQLRDKTNIGDLALRAYWPGRTPCTIAPLAKVLESPEILIPENMKDLPTYIEVIRVVDMMAKFKGVKTFVEDSTVAFISFYHDVGQHLLRWVAKAPKVKESRQEPSQVPTIMSGADDLEVVDDAGKIEAVEREPISEAKMASFIGRLLGV